MPGTEGNDDREYIFTLTLNLDGLSPDRFVMFQPTLSKHSSGVEGGVAWERGPETPIRDIVI